MRIAEAKVVARCADSTGCRRGSAPAASRKPRAYAFVLPPPPYGSVSTSGNPPELLEDLERRGLLSLDAVRVRRVDDHVSLLRAELLGPRERIREGAVDLDDAAADGPHLDELRARRCACGDEDHRLEPGARSVRGSRRGGVAGRRAHDRRRPASTAFVTATLIPRSLNDPVGFAPSHLSQSSTPSRSDRRGACSSGVLPSPSVTVTAAGPRSTGARKDGRALPGTRRSPPAPP